MVKDNAENRIAWVDYAKGICIILVVMMHSTLGVEKAAGTISWLHPFIDWARPFRMPDFFLISGLFLAARINRPWREYLDTKVFHFAYFYILWMSILLLSKSFSLFQNGNWQAFGLTYLNALIQPYSTLWFIYVLAIFFVVTKALQSVAHHLVFIAAALLEIAPVETGYLLIDEFASRYVYFFAGYWLAQYIFKFSAFAATRQVPILLASLLVWGLGNFLVVHFDYATQPGLSLVIGFIGAGAVIVTGVLLSKFKLASALRYCGENSIVIYLAFALFMAPVRTLGLKFFPKLDLGLLSLLVTASSIIGAILLFWASRNTKLSFLFTRPQWAKLAKGKAQWHTDSHVKQQPVKAR